MTQPHWCESAAVASGAASGVAIACDHYQHIIVWYHAYKTASGAIGPSVVWS